MYVQVKHIFIWKVFHEDSFWNTQSRANYMAITRAENHDWVSCFLSMSVIII